MSIFGVRARPTLLIVLVVLTLAVDFISAQEIPDVKQWQIFEVEMTATHSGANTYVAFLQEGKPGHVLVCFTGASGEAVGKEITVTGFWDGGRTWMARFALHMFKDDSS